MKRRTQPKILEHVEVLDTEMGLVYERSIQAATTAANAKERDALIFPRGGSRVEITCAQPHSKFVIDGTQLAFVPRSLVIATVSVSAVHDCLTLYPSAKYMDELFSENALTIEDQATIRNRILKIKRSRWCDDLIDRYHFERLKNSGSPRGCTFFLEKQLLNELARLVFDKLDTTGETLGEETGDLAERALKIIEAGLFDGVTVEGVAERLGCSLSTLNRAFNAGFGMSTGQFLKERRLDEAAHLLERGDYQVGDVAMMVGYADLSAFARAFRGRFGCAPTEYHRETDKGLYRR